MEKPAAKIFTVLFYITFMLFLGSVIVKNVQIMSIIEFGTTDFRQSLSIEKELGSYHTFSQYSLYIYILYPAVIFAAIGFLRTTQRKIKKEGWLLICSILLFLFVPVELFCFWLDWKIIGLNYWGEWPVEEFRKAFSIRLTALAGLPFVAQLCYFTIPIFIIFKPLQKQNSE